MAWSFHKYGRSATLMKKTTIINIGIGLKLEAAKPQTLSCPCRVTHVKYSENDISLPLQWYSLFPGDGTSINGYRNFSMTEDVVIKKRNRLTEKTIFDIMQYKR